MITETLHHYRILEKLGSGGMGVVYRAHDQRLNRDVAIKVLSSELMGDGRGTSRFQREARALAALNHPNIASIYGFEEFNASGALVMELVEGPTLADRISRGRIPFPEALRIALQIAQALECAHEHGIIHRDLKPSNIKLQEDGSVKVLDFGLARFLEPENGSDPNEASTTAGDVTSRPGTIIGTLAYMSPEQARGLKVDRRTDIWAFGVVLYEMLTGRGPFRRPTSSDSIAAIIKEDPDWFLLPEDTPALVSRLRRRCLAKNPHDRLHAIGDARLELEEILSPRAAGGATRFAPPASLASARARLLLWTALSVALLMAALAGWIFLRFRPAPRESARFSILLPSEAPLAPASAMPLAVGRSSLALSPNGARLVYVAFVSGETKLHVRDMASGEYRALLGTEGAHSPFFSPDGEWVGFFAHDKLKKVALRGGQPIVICDAVLGFGGTWAPDGTIYFSTDYSSGLSQVAAAGGPPAPMGIRTQLVLARFFPSLLPSNRGVLFSLQSGAVGVYDFRNQNERVFLRGGTSPQYSPTGHLVFARRGTVQVVPFDIEHLKPAGPPLQLFDRVRTERDGAAQFTFAADGTFIYASGGDGAVGSLVWVDRSGNKQPLQAPVGDYSAFHLSPDGSRVVIPINTPTGADIWLYEIGRGTTTRLTSDNKSSMPVWSPDGNAVYFMNWESGTPNIYRKTIDSGERIQLTHWTGNGGWPSAMSPDGRSLVVARATTNAKNDLWILRMSGDARMSNPTVEEIPVLTSGFDETLADVSPDGHWLTYTSDESGGWEVYVCAFPHPGEKIRISIDGGEEPVWSPNGRELYYRFGTKWFVADVTLGERFTASRPRLLFEGPFANIPSYSYNAAPDGRFLVVEGVEQEKTLTELNVVTNVFDEIKRRTQPGEK
ncbi:MAG TPA: protein kinase [Terriglobales bacterium]|nr:protein kinase [Terriglobales bacterium]